MTTSVATIVVVVFVNGAAVPTADGTGSPVPTDTTADAETDASAVALTLASGPAGIVTATSRTAPGDPVTVIGSAVRDGGLSVGIVALIGATSVSLAGGVSVTLIRTPSGTPVTKIGICVNDGVGTTMVAFTVTLTGSGTPVERMGKGRMAAEKVVLGYKGLARSVGRTREPVPVTRGAVPVTRGTPVTRETPVPRGRAVSTGTMGRTPVPVPIMMPVPVPMGRGRAVGWPYVLFNQSGFVPTTMGRPAEAEAAVPVVRRMGMTVSVMTRTVVEVLAMAVALEMISVALAAGSAVPTGKVEFTGDGTPVTRGIVTLNSPVIMAAVGRMLSVAVPFNTGNGAEMTIADGVASEPVPVEKTGVGTVTLIMEVRSPTGRMEKMISLSGT
jgi:hypothetical protein